MSSDKTELRQVGGKLTSLEKGRLRGEVKLTEALRGKSAITLEVFAHGILLLSVRVKTAEAKDGILPFDVALLKVPQIGLPVRFTARVVENDAALDSEVVLKSLADLWTRVMPFTAEVESMAHDCIVLRVAMIAPDMAAGIGQPVFELRDWGDTIATSRLQTQLPDGSALHVIPLPDYLLDGRAHRLSIVHQDSGLPLSSKPIRLRLSFSADPQPSPREIMTRLATVERQMQERHAEAFNGIAVELYQHIDTMLQNQRSNFEREVAAMRKMLGMVQEASRHPALPEAVMLSFAESVSGYGIHKVQTSSTGKLFRFVSPICGFLLPAIRAESAQLRIQGLRRSHPEALKGAKLAVNGKPLPISPYLNKTSESWNISVVVPGDLLRSDHTLVELRLPNGVLDATRQADMAVGILHVWMGDSHIDVPSA